MRTLRVLAKSLIVALILVLALGTAALAQAAEDQSASLTFEGAGKTRVKGQIILSATLTTTDGKPVGDRTVEFYQQTSIFGDRESHIGSAVTDSSGTAVLAYRPAQTGQQTISIYFTGGSGLVSTSTTGTITVNEVAALFESHPLPLVLLGQWLPVVLAAFVVAAWGVLLGTFVKVVVGLRAATDAPTLVESAQTTTGAKIPGREVAG
jgi:hypothetical protein